MQVVAHKGPNWFPGALAAQSDPGLVAIGTQNTLLLYEANGSFLAEIRALGSAKVSALSFCPAPGLSHLLAVGNTAGLVRIFDVQTRRIFRRVVDLQQPTSALSPILALRFIPALPNVLLIASADNSIRAVRYDDPHNMNSVCYVALRPLFSNISCMECIPANPKLLVVAGEAVHPPNAGVVAFVQLAAEGNIISHFVLPGKPIHGISLRLPNRELEITRYSLVAISGADIAPMLFTSPDARVWKSEGAETEHSPEIARKAAAGTVENTSNPTKAKLRAAISWCRENTLLASDAKGALNVWSRDPSGKFQIKTSRKLAHVRQVFSIMRTSSNGFYYSISMDHSLAAWRIDGLESCSPKVELMWRTIGIRGAVQSLAVSDVSSSLHRHDKISHVSVFDTIISCIGVDSKVMCIAWNQRTDRYAVLGEVSPSGTSSKKRKRPPTAYMVECNKASEEDGSNVTHDPYIALFGNEDGLVGVVGYCEGRLAISDYKGKCSGKVKSWSFLKNSHGASPHLLSVDSKNRVDVWQVPHDALQVVAKKSQKTQLTKREIVFEKGWSANILSFCLLSLKDNDDYLCLTGDVSGKLSVLSKTGQCIIKEFDSGLRSIMFIAYSDDLHIAAMSDRHGGLAAFHLDIPGYSARTKNTPLEAEQFFSRKQVLNGTSKSPFCLLSWSRIPPSQHPDNASVYLAAVPEKGDTLVWECSHQGAVKKRAELKGHFGPVRATTWFNNTYLFTGGHDGTVRRWHIDSQPRL